MSVFYGWRYSLFPNIAVRVSSSSNWSFPRKFMTRPWTSSSYLSHRIVGSFHFVALITISFIDGGSLSNCFLALKRIVQSRKSILSLVFQLFIVAKSNGPCIITSSSLKLIHSLYGTSCRDFAIFSDISDGLIIS